MKIQDERQMRFVYARYHVTGLFAKDLPSSFPKILHELQTAKHDDGKYIWTMGDIGEQKIDGAKLIYGRLGKTAREVVETRYDDSAHSFRREHIQSRKAAYSNFFIDPTHAIIALEDKPLLPRGKFLKKFKQFWEEEQITEIDFDFLKNELEIFEIIKRWDKITEAKFDLSPTNPHPREDFTPLDNIIKKAKARRARLKFEGGRDGLAKDDSIVQQGTSMSAAGYGEFGLKGIEKGSKKVLSSRSLLISNEMVKVDDLESLTPEVLSEIRKILKQINDGKTQ